MVTTYIIVLLRAYYNPGRHNIVGAGFQIQSLCQLPRVDPFVKGFQGKDTVIVDTNT
jgi:hypothetical protein